MALVHIREYITYHERFSNPYNPDGHCRGKVEAIPNAERLAFDLDEETRDEAYKVSKGIADDFENASMVFREFGKDLVKKAKPCCMLSSPFALLQSNIF